MIPFFTTILLPVIEIALLSIFGAIVLYLMLLTLLALTSKKGQPVSKVKYTRRFALVVPAHNEEIAIAQTLDSLLAVHYPQGYFKVIVVADNCTDRTAEIARERGVLVYERTDQELRGKGYALRWCFDQILSKQYVYEAVVVIDADSVVSANFLTVMNYYLEQGAQVIQSCDMVAPKPGIWSAEITRLGFTLYNHVRPLGRKRLKTSAGLRGNGMCFSTLTLRTVPWDAFSVAEDVEYGLHLLLHDIPVVYAPEAEVLATMPENARNAESQRARWEQGRLPVIRRNAGPLLKAVFTRMSGNALDALIDLIIPPLVTVVAAIICCFGVTVALWIFGIDGLELYIAAWAALFLLSLSHVLLGLLAAEADRHLYKALFYIPRYAVWKGYLRLKTMRGSPTRWIRTTREHQIPSSLVKKEH